MMMGLLGLGPHSGSHWEWTNIAGELGAAKQKRANKIQYRNLLLEIKATRARHAAMAATNNPNTLLQPEHAYFYPKFPLLMQYQ